MNYVVGATASPQITNTSQISPEQMSLPLIGGISFNSSSLSGSAGSVIMTWQGLDTTTWQGHKDFNGNVYDLASYNWYNSTEVNPPASADELSNEPDYLAITRSIAGM